MGSPPRGRGKVTLNSDSYTPSGITPAWAGKSLTKHKVTTRSWDHPRVGGEKPANAPLCAPCPGSPPRGRGKARRPDRKGRAFRITPAWAGKSFRS